MMGNSIKKQAEAYATSKVPSGYPHPDWFAAEEAYLAGAKAGVKFAAQYIEGVRMVIRIRNDHAPPPYDFDTIEMDTAKNIARDLLGMVE
jgi:hypothetical protein